MQDLGLFAIPRGYLADDDDDADSAASARAAASEDNGSSSSTVNSRHSADSRHMTPQNGSEEDVVQNTVDLEQCASILRSSTFQPWPAFEQALATLIPALTSQKLEALNLIINISSELEDCPLRRHGVILESMCSGRW
jgi:hypothetical protein